jgi:hypothetical protein
MSRNHGDEDRLVQRANFGDRGLRRKLRYRAISQSIRRPGIREARTFRPTIVGRKVRAIINMFIKTLPLGVE